MFWTAFTIGLLGSTHCVGMCGPIAIALPYPGQSRWQRTASMLLYNFGRISTYIGLGLIFGLFGKGISLAGGQSILSIVLGIILLAMALFSIDMESKIFSIPIWHQLIFKLKMALGTALKKQGAMALYSVGLLNGLLPCGMVYIAIFGALAAGSLINGMWYMFWFGLGTLPLMLLVSIAGSWTRYPIKKYLNRLFPVVLAGFGILLILRGLEVDLPRSLEILQDIPMCGGK